MSPSLPLVIGHGQLPLAELSAARLDGELRALGEAYCSIDVHPSADLRAAALPTVPEALIAERRTAAWLLGADPRFTLPMQFCLRSTRRPRVPPTSQCVVRQVVLADDEIVVAGGVRLTSPLRTAIDLLRWQPDFDTGLARTVATLLLGCRLGTGGCAAVLRSTPHLPHKRRALERLEAVAELGLSPGRGLPPG
ncbi:MAG: hypothetical protein Q7T71_04315 [Herbiconiux sp.]|nr:hypothetical protein [Herbiconiux sp.]